MNQVAYQHRNKVYQPETVSPESVLLESKNDPHYNSALVECYSYLGYYYLLAIENPALKAEAKANKDKSIEYWNKILALDPANATAKRALDGIK